MTEQHFILWDIFVAYCTCDISGIKRKKKNNLNKIKRITDIIIMRKNTNETYCNIDYCQETTFRLYSYQTHDMSLGKLPNGLLLSLLFTLLSSYEAVLIVVLPVLLITEIWVFSSVNKLSWLWYLPLLPKIHLLICCIFGFCPSNKHNLWR